MIDEMKIGLERFREGLENDRPIYELQNEWTDTVDGVVRSLFNAASKECSSMAVFALGGYGRREMSPYSDVDLMFLYEGKGPLVKQAVDAVLYPLWNSKFEAGGATRTLKDCALMFKGEIRAQTAMLDARFLAGDRDLGDRFLELVKRKLNDKSWKKRFARAKFNEQEIRFRKFGGSVYVLEPNVKESEGGLREFQTACWIAKALGIKPPESDDVRHLLKLRALLHFSTGKRDDRLTFDNQKTLALRLGCSPEELMSGYYRATSSIHNMAKPVTQNASPFLSGLLKRWRIERVKKMIGSEPSWQRLAANRDILFDAVSILHETGELFKLIPSFEKIYCRTQYGAYHVYTVDIHSIFALKNILELERSKDHPLLRGVYEQIKGKDVLFLSALLHDIGKNGEGEGGHSRRGADIAMEEALRLGYSKDDAEKIAFLVGSHLIMPRLAFSRDLADRQLIENFAGSVETLPMLDMLFILSYADIVSIGPDVWTAWKEKLLGELYLSAKKLLSGEKTAHAHKEIERMRHKAEQEDDGHSRIWFQSMPERYFAANTPDEIRSHIEMFRSFTTQALMAKHMPHDTYSEFLIMTSDAPGIFARMAGVMAANNVNIMDAELNTGKNGIVFDILRVTSEIGGPVSEALALRIIRGMEDVLSGRKDVAELLKKRPGAIKRRGADVEPMVVIDNDVSVYYTVVDILAKDRVGLLYDLAKALFDNGCSIAVAKILTNADFVKDSFYIKSAGGGKLSSKERLEEIRTALLGVL